MEPAQLRDAQDQYEASFAGSLPLAEYVRISHHEVAEDLFIESLGESVRNLPTQGGDIRTYLSEVVEQLDNFPTGESALFQKLSAELMKLAIDYMRGQTE